MAADVASVLHAGGIVADPADVVAAAAAAGLPPAAMAAKLKRESFGGKNVFGNDRVAYPTSGPYTADTVTVIRAAVDAYLSWRGPAGRHRNRQNGVGPSQLTWAELQDQAEHEGGLHIPRVNMTVGARELARCFRAGGGSWREAGARYNGGRAYAQSSTAAQEYGRWLAGAVADWEHRLADTEGDDGDHGRDWDPSTMPGLREGDESDLIWRLQRWMNAKYGSYSHIGTGDSPPSRLGPQSVAAFSEWQRRSGITPTDPFAWGPKSWNAAKAAEFPG